MVPGTIPVVGVMGGLVVWPGPWGSSSTATAAIIAITRSSMAACASVIGQGDMRFGDPVNICLRALRHRFRHGTRRRCIGLLCCNRFRSSGMECPEDLRHFPWFGGCRRRDGCCLFRAGLNDGDNRCHNRLRYPKRFRCRFFCDHQELGCSLDGIALCSGISRIFQWCRLLLNRWSRSCRCR